MSKHYRFYIKRRPRFFIVVDGYKQSFGTRQKALTHLAAKLLYRAIRAECAIKDEPPGIDDLPTEFQRRFNRVFEFTPGVPGSRSTILFQDARDLLAKQLNAVIEGREVTEQHCWHISTTHDQKEAALCYIRKAISDFLDYYESQQTDRGE